MLDRPGRFSKIACIGEVMLELVQDETGAPALNVAGDSYNTAVYLARSLRGSAVSTAYVTALGTDPYSDRIVSEMLQHGLDSSLVERRNTHLPGIYAVHTSDAGERSFSYWRSDSAARTLFQQPCEVALARLDGFDLIYLSGISVAILAPEIRQRVLDWIDQFRAKGGRVAYDSNYRPRLWDSVQIARDVTRAFWQRTDIALPSLDDEMDLFGDESEAQVLHRLRSFGVKAGALKRGQGGPLDLAQQCLLGALPIVSDVVDTTAAGDSFNAAYLAQLALGESTEQALRAGHNLASEVIRYRGAIIPASPANLGTRTTK